MTTSPRRSIALLGACTALIASIVVPAEAAVPPAVPRADCGPGSDPESGIQGRVSTEDVESGRAERGFTCNAEIIGRNGTPFTTGGSGGYKVFRYIDDAGHECAFYDTTLLFPMNVPKPATDLTGVIVLDMTDPTQPVQTANLLTPAMQTPHESLSLNVERGLLAATMGNPGMYPGVVDIYDVKSDCRQPVLQSTTPLGILGHEANFSPDGNTFWVTSTNLGFITALDVSDPTRPSMIWNTRGIGIHGFSISDDGTRFYGADASRKGLTILDVSQVQARVANPVVTQVSFITWPTASIPQHTIPVTIDGSPYLVEIDEFGSGATVGAARIIDIADDTAPVVVSDIRLEVHHPDNQPAIANDPGAQWALGGYTGHYCAVPSRNEPGILACSFILSGMRVFDISDAFVPREIAYVNAPIPREPGVPGGSNGSFTPHAAYAMSAPAFVPERREIWYSDGSAGFLATRLTNDVWT